MARTPTDTKERIVETATHLFSTHGFGGTAVDDILSAVGITKGAFYHYFNSKESLCEATVDAAIEAHHTLAESLQDTGNGPHALHDWLALFIARQTSGQWLHCRLLTRLSIEAGELNAAVQLKLSRFWLWCQGLYKGLIRSAQRNSPRHSTIDPDAAARLFIAAVFGALWLDRCAPAPQDLTVVCETLLRQLI